LRRFDILEIRQNLIEAEIFRAKGWFKAWPILMWDGLVEYQNLISQTIIVNNIWLPFVFLAIKVKTIMKKYIYLAFALALLVACQPKESTFTTPVSPMTLIIPADGAHIPSALLPEILHYTIKPASDTVLTIGDRGTKLHIPKNAFVSESGEAISTPVQLSFQEYTNSAEIAFSGIPMTYNRNGEELYFNSSGMFDVQGQSEGRSIQIAGDKSLTVDYALAKQNPDIDFYKLDDQGENWELVSEIQEKKYVASSQLPEARKDQADSTFNELTIVQALEKEVIQDPLPPLLFDVKDERLISLTPRDVRELREFSQYREVWFHVLDSSQYNKADADKDWQGYNFREGVVKGTYEVRFYGETNGIRFSSSYNVRPVFKGEDFRKSMVNHRRIVLKNKEKREAKARAEALAMRQIPGTIFQIPEDDRSISTLLGDSKTDPAHMYPKIIKGLNVASFGVYNCDQAYRLRNVMVIQASGYIDDKGNTIHNPKMLSVIDLEYNGAFSNSPTSFWCSESGRTVLLLFSKSGELYILDEAGFQKSGIKESGSYVIHMKNVSREIKSSDDLAKYIGLEV